MAGNERIYMDDEELAEAEKAFNAKMKYLDENPVTVSEKDGRVTVSGDNLSTPAVKAIRKIAEDLGLGKVRIYDSAEED